MPPSRDTEQVDSTTTCEQYQATRSGPYSGFGSTLFPKCTVWWSKFEPTPQAADGR